ncbi:alpha/beta hydrolase [Rhodovastum sp. RN2-1]|uniref:Alpha/beta hydrolase n=2 Tax=Limobrevibacterium gyesilva TaxID=2991712 RepID=A0AA41YP45_9PROT|nr:alpha/beta hydrolase [Limobrevibacterium gyesilva]
MALFEGFAERRIDTGEAVINLRMAGNGPPLLLLHGYPQTHAMWHRLAPALARRFTVVLPDLRGYGDSSKPPGGDDHAGYGKRAMADDQVRVMEELGFTRFQAVGHDRGARVLHRMCLDYPDQVTRAALLDIVPTALAYGTADQAFATAYFHWFFLIQRHDLPERLLAAAPDAWIERMLGLSGAGSEVFAPEAVAEYKRCFRNPATIHASCEDYRAAASTDLADDEEDADTRIACPLLVLWGGKSVVGRLYDPLAIWKEKAADVRGQALPCGHFLPEEAPEETLAALGAFLEG